MNKLPLKEIEQRLEDRIKTIISQLNFKILIWGPGMNQRSIHLDKRVQIKEALEQVFPNFNTHFSEEFSSLNSIYGPYFSEGVQTEEFNFIIILNTSPGTIGEIYDFAETAYNKILVLVNKSHIRSQSYIAGFLKYLPHYEFSDEEYDQCNLATEVCPHYIARKVWREHVRRHVHQSNHP